MQPREFLSRCSSVLLCVCLGVAGGSSRLRAQECLGCADGMLSATSGDSWTLRRQVNEVHVLFTASQHGRFVDGLTRDDVAVRDNNEPAAILDFRDQRDLPLRIALLVDTSDSVKRRFSFEKAAASAFLRQVLRQDGDMALVAGFSSHFHLLQDFSHDDQALSQAIAELAQGGGTALYDAITTACRRLARPEPQMVARVLIVLSDGDDNASRVDAAAAIAIAQQAEVTIYTVSTNYQATDFAGDQNLVRLARETGGKALFPGTARAVARAFGNIGEELRNRYAVAYRPPKFKADGHFRRIRVLAVKAGKKLKVKTRKGYYARVSMPF